MGSRPFARCLSPAAFLVAAAAWLALSLAPAPAIRAAAPPATPAPGSHAAAITLKWTRGSDPGSASPLWTVEAHGIPAGALRALRGSAWTVERWQQLLPVFAGQGDLAADASLPPMLGQYRVANDRIVFQPQFPLQPGVAYRAVFHPSELPAGFRFAASQGISASLNVDAARAESRTTVAGVFPSADELPENLLKFYLQFSHPMSRGGIYEHIQLLDEAGRAIELPFLEIDEELWDPSMTRLTLFIDPGRIKRGVTPLEEVGPALLNGHRYVLAIDSRWHDAAGAPLKAEFRKSFRVGPPNRTPIAIRDWKIQAPLARSTEPLIVIFDRPMDWALARRLIGVQRADGRGGKAIPGEAQLGNHESTWRFTPSRPWRPGRYSLHVASTLEDLAGNNIGKSFEVDLFDSIQRRVTNAVEQIAFEVK